jgi:hypothetical protein
MTLREAHEGDLKFLQQITQTGGWLANIGPRGTESLGIVHLEAFQGEPSQHWRKLLTSL